LFIQIKQQHNILYLNYPIWRPSHQHREKSRLAEAMNFFDKPEGTLVTFNQEDLIRHNNKKIKVIPAYKFISETLFLKSAMNGAFKIYG